MKTLRRWLRDLFGTDDPYAKVLSRERRDSRRDDVIGTAHVPYYLGESDHSSSDYSGGGDSGGFSGGDGGGAF